jgi:hypothetical protein
MKLPYREFDVENFVKIQTQLIPYVLDRFPEVKNFWNHVDQFQLFEHVPDLLAAVINITGQTPLKTYLLAVSNSPVEVLNQKLNSNSLHRDTSTESCRLNWPLLNSTSIETRFFESTVESTKLILPTGEAYLTYQESDCNIIGKFVMSKPAILHVHTIHGLYRAPGPLPRYILSFNFENPIEHLLNPI